MNKPRQRRNRFYYEKLKQEKFKEAAKALPINIEMLTKGKTNGTTHIKRANAAEPKHGWGLNDEWFI